jgi:hypothetical protein
MIMNLKKPGWSLIFFNSCLVNDEENIFINAGLFEKLTTKAW